MHSGAIAGRWAVVVREIWSAVRGELGVIVGASVSGPCVCGAHVAGLAPHSRRSRDTSGPSASKTREGADEGMAQRDHSGAVGGGELVPR